MSWFQFLCYLFCWKRKRKRKEDNGDIYVVSSLQLLIHKRLALHLFPSFRITGFSTSHVILLKKCYIKDGSNRRRAFQSDLLRNISVSAHKYLDLYGCVNPNLPVEIVSASKLKLCDFLFYYYYYFLGIGHWSLKVMVERFWNVCVKSNLDFCGRVCSWSGLVVGLLCK